MEFCVVKDITIWDTSLAIGATKVLGLKTRCMDSVSSQLDLFLSYLVEYIYDHAFEKGLDFLYIQDLYIQEMR